MVPAVGPRDSPRPRDRELSGGSPDRDRNPPRGEITKTTLVLALLVLNPSSEAWEPFRFFIGSWEGESSGSIGRGTVTREYSWVLNERFIEVRNRSVYPPQELNKGEDHQDIGYISFDSRRGKHVLRQFHVEGFVNQYVHESTSEDGRTMVFVSEAIENIAPGWRARETYVILGPDEFIERFELAEPGKDFELYTENRLRRVAK